MRNKASNSKKKDCVFRPEAMLPAWFVTDGEHFAVRNANPHGCEIYREASGRESKELFEGVLSINPSASEGCLWDRLFEPADAKQAGEAMQLVLKHREIVEEFTSSGISFPVAKLIERMQQVTPAGAASPYVFKISDGESWLRAGIRISAPDGLRLRKHKQGGQEAISRLPPEVVDVVLAYQIRVLDLQLGRAASVCFVGTQPAIHDATERVRLLQNSIELEELRVTQYISHALKTPLGNAMSWVDCLRSPKLNLADVPQYANQILAHTEELEQLIDLLLFVNTTEPMPVFAVPQQGAGEYDRLDYEAIVATVASTLRGVFYGRTRRAEDEERVQQLFVLFDLPIPERTGPSNSSNHFTTLATRVIQFEDGDDCWYMLVPGNSKAEFATQTIATRARTVALHLILAELILNAIKHSIPALPPKVQVNVNQCFGCLNIDVFNTGILPEFDEVASQIRAAEIQGYRRQALGRMLAKNI